jgi:uncharacterized membrane protein YfcA
MLGFRRELRGIEPRMFALVIPSLAGGVGGAMLLKLTPAGVFDRLVPLLILFATCLFMAQDAVQRWLRIGASTSHRGEDGTSAWPRLRSSEGWALAFQLAVGIYGWPDVIVMAVGAIAGGVGGAGLARRLGRLAVRRIVITVGLVMAVKLMLR